MPDHVGTPEQPQAHLTGTKYSNLVGLTTAAAMLGVDRPRAWRLVDGGRLIPALRLGNALGFEREDVERVGRELQSERREREQRRSAAQS